MKGITITELDYDDPEEIWKMARIHESGPLDWIPGYELDESRVEERAESLGRTQDDEKTCVLVARNGEQEMVGFHWLTLVEKYDAPCARIDSLWVDVDYRRMGIAQSLKARGEAWTKGMGATQMVSEITSRFSYTANRIPYSVNRIPYPDTDNG